MWHHHHRYTILVYLRIVKIKADPSMRRSSSDVDLKRQKMLFV